MNEQEATSPPRQAVVIVPSAGIKPQPVRGGVNVGMAMQGDRLTADPDWTPVTMVSGASAGKKGWLPSLAIGPATLPVAFGIYTLNTAVHNWTDSWAGTQRTLLGATPAIVHVFKPWSLTAPEGGPWAAFDPVWADDALKNGAVPMISWEGRDLSLDNTVPQPKYSNAAVLSGQWDSVLIPWLKAVGAWGKRIILRLDHEGNGKWFSWAAGCNGNTPESAIAAFRYKVRLMRMYAPNAESLWTPGDFGSDCPPLEDCYPGSMYVDWLGFDWYNTGSLPGGWSGGWKEFSGAAPIYNRICALDPNKRLIVAEAGSVSEAGHDKAAWYTAIPGICATMPRIAAVVVFDQTYGALDFRISADPTVYAAWKSLVKAGGSLT